MHALVMRRPPSLVVLPHSFHDETFTSSAAVADAYQ